VRIDLEALVERAEKIGDANWPILDGHGVGAGFTDDLAAFDAAAG